MSEHVITAICRNFSSSSNNTVWDISGEDKLEGYLKFSDIKFSANGNCEENEGYVSILLYHNVETEGYEIWENREIRCYVSVVDVTRNKKFTRSAVCAYDNINPHFLEEGFIFDLGRYLKRDTLLNDPAELLPNDCLTLCVEVDVIYHFNGLLSPLGKIFNGENHFYKCEKGTLWLPLDTDFGKELCRVSSYFRCASDNGMIESRTRKVRFQYEEALNFMTISDIFHGFGDMLFSSIGEIFKLYHAAYKYDIEFLTETCRQFVKAILRSVQSSYYRECAEECIPEILKLAHFYKDNELKEIVEIYLKSKENFGKDDYAFGQYMREIVYTDWICEFIQSTNSRHPMINMTRRIEEPKFEFYQ